MKKKRILTLAACGLCLTGIVIGASAATVVQKVQSELRPDFTIVIDGKEQIFKDAQGNTVYPMLYDGTTYLPVRAIGEMMGKTVYWYEDEKKVELKTENTTVTDADVIVPSGSSGSTKPSLNTGLTPESNEITLDEAKKIALDKAGLSENDVTFTKTRLGIDDGVREYEIEFWYGMTEYSAEITAADGTIRSWDIDNNERPAATARPDTSSANDIGVEKAKEMALEKAGLSASEVTFTESKPDYDDGRLVYDIEFRVGRTEYSAEILASDGTVISWDIDND